MCAAVVPFNLAGYFHFPFNNILFCLQRHCSIGKHTHAVSQVACNNSYQEQVWDRSYNVFNYKGFC